MTSVSEFRDVLWAGHCHRPGQLPLGGPRLLQLSAGSAAPGRVHLDLRVKCRSWTALPHNTPVVSLQRPPPAVSAVGKQVGWGTPDSVLPWPHPF